MTALKLVFELGSPITRPSMPIHLDAVLFYCAIDGGVPENEARDLLDRAIVRDILDDGPLYHSSALLFETGHAFTRYATRHFSISDYAQAMAAGIVKARADTFVNLSSGPVRGRLAFVPMLWTRCATAWLECADPNALNALLAHVRFIGKHSNLGHGRVTAITPQSCDDNGAWMRRVLPNPVDGAEPVHATVRPPYWDRSSARKAYLHPALLTGEHGLYG